MSTNNSNQKFSSSDGPDSHRSIIKSTSILSGGTLTSRILGFFRDIILAKLLGTSFSADAFFVAFKIPNLFRSFVGEGATNSAVVPIFSEYLENEKREDFWDFVRVIYTLAFIAMSVITVLGIIFAPYIVRILVPGFISEPAKLSLTIRLTRLMFPYLIFIGMTAYSMGILYTFRSFLAPAFSPCLLNISIITSAFISFRFDLPPVYILTVGILVGGLLQFLIQVVPLYKVGMRMKGLKSLKHPGATRIFKLLVPRIIGSGVYQLTILIDAFCASIASIVGAGGISAIYYANRIVQVPLGVFVVALSSAVLPTLSGFANRKDIESIKKTLVFSLENVFFVMFPSTIFLLVLSTPIIRALFQRGEFNIYSTSITSASLLFYSLGLFSFGGIKILVTAFHALQDTKTPVKVAAICLGVNALLNVILMFPLKIGGIALASSIAGTIDFLILFYVMNKKLGGINSGLAVFFIKVTLASIIMGYFISFCWQHFSTSHEIMELACIGFLGCIIYLIMTLALKVPQSQKILEFISNKSHS